VRKEERNFEKFYFEFRKSLFWYVRKKVGSDEVAQDITAEVFIKLFENREILKKRDESGLKAWLYTVARNQIIDFYRKKSNNVEIKGIDDDIFDLVVADRTEHLQGLIRDEKYQMIMAAMENLEGPEKEVVTLRFNDELSFKEIAQILQKEEGAVKMTLYRAIEKIKKIINYENEEE